MDIFKRKILVIGIDGATWDIFDEILNNEYMPYLKKLKDNGAYGIMKSSIPPISPTAWATVQTGIDAIQSNIYEYFYFNKISKKFKIVNSNLLKNSIWNILSNLGKKIAVVNVPMTFPPKKVNGYIISGLLTPSIKSNFTYPSELKEEILKKIPDYQLRYTEDKRYGKPLHYPKKFTQQRIKNIKDRTKICIYLINNYNLDILMVNFQANDILQHSLWGIMDKTHSLYNEKLKKYIFSHFYKTLDFCIETLREQFIRKSSGELLTIVLSDHGFESHYKEFYLGDWLYQNGFLKIKTKIRKFNFQSKFNDLILKLNSGNTLINILRNFKIKGKKDKKNIVINNEKKFLLNIIDWDKSFTFSVGINLYGHLFILKEGKEREKLIRILTNKLNQLKDPENGMKIIEKIYTKEEIYQGDNPNLIPDLILKPIKGYSFVGMYKGKKKLLKKIKNYESETIGKHNEDGIIILNGNTVLNKKIVDVNLKDIVPTILKYFEVPIDKAKEDRVLGFFK